ncbi:MAG: ComF family protein [Candidatus Levybacteria bacterium]|nr:ComF family protein [Candidatus Levybacteria bacterium]
MGLLDFIFPKYCVNCKKFGDYLCPNCFARLSYDTKNICLACGNPSFDGLTHPRCRGRYVVEGSFTGVVFNSVSKKLIYQFKYKPYLSSLASFLTDLLYESLIQNEEFVKILRSFPPEAGRQDDSLNDIFFVPIPLSSKRFKKRGYNQAEILAKSLGKKLGFPVYNCLIRIRETKSQVGLDKKKRKENVRGAFAVKVSKASKVSEGELKNANIFLVDDVLTTGSTFSEACWVLKRNGAAKVWAVAFAREQ